MGRRIASFCLWLLILAGCGGASAACLPLQAALPSSADSLPLQAALASSAREYAVPASSAAWMEGGTVLCAYVGDGVGSDSLFCIGSVSKSFVAALALLLQQEGKLSLQDTVGHYFPAFDHWNRDHITLRDLLSMRSGIADYTQDFTQADYFREFNADELIARGLARSALLRHGEFHYSNTNILIAQKMIEAAAGERCEALIQKKILSPLGLDDTYFASEKGRLRPRLARGVSDMRSAKNFDFTDTTGSWAGLACGMISTARDMAAWGNALLHGPLLSAESKRELLRFADCGQGFGYGLCVADETVRGRQCVALTGNVPGYGAAVYVTDNATVAVLCGRSDYSGSDFSYAEEMAGEIMETPNPDPLPGPQTLSPSPPPSRLLRSRYWQLSAHLLRKSPPQLPG